ncbi:MAG TPA: ferritin-like domain-containing protein [Kofleriaceae bacterium]|nr:ferritin-like domain-containing protein [Kofleriaceae bacterium]
MAAGCVGTSPGGSSNACAEHHVTTLTRSTPSSKASLQLEIESCRVDVDACIVLCSQLMSDASLMGTLQTCDVSFESDQVDVTVAYDVYRDTNPCGSIGRRPEGLVAPRRTPAQTALGAWFANTAWLEASSICAFLQLAKELREHGAPRALVRLADASARDEVRHAALMSKLARRFGGVPPVVEVMPARARSLEALAIENAVEGCVRETWGAVVALWQSERAPDPELRAAFALIARDEVRHAALGWAIDRWATSRLDHGAQVRVALAREAAVRALADERPDELPAIGLPGAADARRLHARTYSSLWNGGLS